MMSRMKEGGVVGGFEVGESWPSSSSERSRMKRSARDMVGVSVCEE